VQAPIEHVWFVHGVGIPHMPMLLHWTTPLPEHFKSPIAQTPTHAPSTQVEFEHGINVVLHIPFVPHGCTLLPEHCTSPGVHAPWHTPMLHTPLPHSEGALQLPSIWHV
jgi:hypothetical protein